MSAILDEPQSVQNYRWYLQHVKRYQSMYYTCVQMLFTGTLMLEQLCVIEWFDNTLQQLYYLMHISVQSLVQPWFKN